MVFEKQYFIFLSQIIPFIFMISPTVFFKKKFVRPFYFVTVPLAIIGILLFISDASDKAIINLSFATPLYTLVLLRAGLIIFKLKFNRFPIDATDNWLMEDDGYRWDRVFYFFYIMLSLCLPILLLIDYA